MAELITAIYEKGTLRPLEPLQLREHQLVWIRVVSEHADPEADARDRALQILTSAGLVEPQRAGSSLSDPLSAEARQALADRLGCVQGKTASEIVIEDRGEW